MGGGIEHWIAAGAPGAERFTHDWICAHPSDVYGPDLSAGDVAALLNYTISYVQKLAAAAVARAAESWSDEYDGTTPSGERVTYRVGEHGIYTNAAGEPLPLLRFESGSPAYLPDGAGIAVACQPSRRQRGRPRTTAGEAGWRLRRCAPSWEGEHTYLPDWWPDGLDKDGRDPEGRLVMKPVLVPLPRG